MERAPGVACRPTRSPPLALHQRANPVAAGLEEPLLLLLGVAQEVAVAIGDEDAQRDGLQHGRRHDRGARRDHHREDGEDLLYIQRRIIYPTPLKRAKEQ